MRKEIEMFNKIRETANWFLLEMATKLFLESNIEKSDWSECSDEYLLKRIKEEFNELVGAKIKGNPDDIISEACDVANFCMMLADNYKNKIKKVPK